jgi:Sulfotransferase domain
MMQMLAAGGLMPLSDGERKADTDNPRGYLEWERIKQLPKDPQCIAEAENKVVKVVSQLLTSLPKGWDYRVVFMQRPLVEVLKSQDEMLVRRGKYNGATDLKAVAQAFEKHLSQIETWLASRPDVSILRVPYHEVLRDPRSVAETISGFLKVPLDVGGMTGQVDTKLYRNRTA